MNEYTLRLLEFTHVVDDSLKPKIFKVSQTRFARARTATSSSYLASQELHSRDQKMLGPRNSEAHAMCLLSTTTVLRIACHDDVPNKKIFHIPIAAASHRASRYLSSLLYPTVQYGRFAMFKMTICQILEELKMFRI